MDIGRVRWFAEEMEKELKTNDSKGSWEDEDVLWLFGRLLEEVEELRVILEQSDGMESSCPDYKDVPDIISEAADVANFAMMIADRVR